MPMLPTLPFPSKNTKETPHTLQKVDTNFSPKTVSSLTFLICGPSQPSSPAKMGRCGKLGGPCVGAGKAAM